MHTASPGQSYGIVEVLVAMKRHLWLNLAQLPDKEKVPLLNSPVTAIGLSGVAVGAMRVQL